MAWILLIIISTVRNQTIDQLISNTIGVSKPRFRPTLNGVLISPEEKERIKRELLEETELHAFSNRESKDGRRN